jgi:hypothetical protein
MWEGPLCPGNDRGAKAAPTLEGISQEGFELS